MAKLLVVLVGLAACVGVGRDEPAPTREAGAVPGRVECFPAGERRACVCGAGRASSQACAEDGGDFAWGPCECAAPVAERVLTVRFGNVNARNAAGGAWDADGGGAPDPFVCVTLGGRRVCSPVCRDAYACPWDFAFPAANEDELVRGVVVEFLDEDGDVDEAICAARTVSFADRFAAGNGFVTCGSGGFSYGIALR